MTTSRLRSTHGWVAVAAVVFLVVSPLAEAQRARERLRRPGRLAGPSGFRENRLSTSISVEDGFTSVQASSQAGSLRLNAFQTPVSFEVTGSEGATILVEEDDDLGARFRPDGDWTFIVEGRIPNLPDVVWDTVKNIGSVFQYSFQKLALGVDPVTEDQSEWRIRLTNMETIFFKKLETNNDDFYHIVEIVSHTDGVFPGFNAEGTRFYFLVLAGDRSGTSVIEFGWEGQGREDPGFSLESLFQEMVSNLEEKFGTTCELLRNIRSIEGDCNNLRNPRLGAANHPLKRLSKHDPSYVDGVGTPSGANISPRKISNEIHAQSPGVDFLQQRLEDMKEECFVSEEAGAGWEVCPLSRATRESDSDTAEMAYVTSEKDADGSVDLVYEDASGCQLRIRFVCDGEDKLIMDTLGGLGIFGDSCEHFGWLYSPNACSKVAGDDGVGSNKAGLTDLFWTMGQFIDHDLDLTPTTQLAEENQPGFRGLGGSDDQLPISVPEQDFFFKDELEFERATVFEGIQQSSARRTHLNAHSAYLDLGQVYGVDFLRSNSLRSFDDGKLKVSPGNMLPYNKLSGFGALNAKLSNAPDAGDRFMVAGDIRANEQSLLLVMHILWVREHNLVCDELHDRFPDWDDERLYQTARTIVISEYQSIVYSEWLKLLLGDGVVDPARYAYDASVDPSIQAIFSTAAFRFGHSMVGSYLWQMGQDKIPTALPIRDVFFNPSIVEQSGIEPFFRGGAWHICKEIDEKIVDELRNFLFAEGGGGHLHDLVSLNIQRGRDMGLPSFNNARDAYGMSRYTSFDQINDDKFAWKTLERVYESSVESIDVFPGGLIEKKAEGSQLGLLFHEVIKDQFTRMRDGDRFFYKGVKWSDELLAAYPRVSKINLDEIKLSDIIVRNSDISADEMGLDRFSVFKAN
ncbi:hypothetical protein BSKO_08695 [Bryopsis sp. KO-2023]|nr:hypothetical protein BSKO_08695 [Bryopsis sp. KO-2023]